MGKHSGEPVEEETSALPRKRLLGLALGLTATLVFWGYLVWAAIDFGGQGRDGETSAWVFAFLATVGATACLFAFLVLGSKVLEVLRGQAAPAKPSTPGKRVAR